MYANAVCLQIGRGIKRLLCRITGINTVMLYSAKLFKIAGLADPFMANITADLVNVLVTIISLQIVDNYGRRKLLILSSALMTPALMCLSGSLLYLDNYPRLQGHITVLCVLFFIAGFAIGLGGVVWYASYFLSSLESFICDLHAGSISQISLQSKFVLKHSQFIWELATFGI